MKVDIVGAAGYGGGEVIRLLLQHPMHCDIRCTSSTFVGASVADVHKDLAGEYDVPFAEDVRPDADVIFLCGGHGASATWMKNHTVSDTTLVIDLSADFRADTSWTYGLSEVHHDAIRTSRRIANPGCFATSIELGLYPLRGIVNDNTDIHIHAVTGSTGAGQQPTDTTHFSWRTANQSVYKPFEHQHLAEITATLAPFAPSLFFVPMRGAFARGIHTSMTFRTAEAYRIIDAVKTFAASTRFVRYYDDLPDLKRVINTNRCALGVTVQDDRVLIVSVLDNLIKGAAGQAVQNMNIALGLAEDSGLNLKSIVY